MMVLAIEGGDAGIRGHLTRWLLELRPGVMVGNVNALVREELCKMLEQSGEVTAYVCVWTSDGEQGFRTRMFGDPRRSPIDIEGLTLIRVLPT